MKNRSYYRPRRPKKSVPEVVGARDWFTPVGLLLILLMTFFVYFPALNGGKLWDDDQHITAPELQSLAGLHRIWFDPSATIQYYPLMHTAFWFEHKLWGDAVLGYHVVNLFCHSVSVVLLYFILKKLKVPGALLAAAIFALHPVMVESVAWMCEQKNTLSTAFYLGAMLLYIGFDETRRRPRYFMALVLFLAALMTKTITVSLPAALLVVLWWRRGRLSWRRDVLPLVPFFALSLASGLLTIWVEKHYIGAEGAEFEMLFAQRVLLAARAVWFYLSKLVWPVNLTFSYPRWAIDPAAWWQWMFLVATVGTTIALWATRKRWRAPLAGWLLFCGTLLPVLGFLNVYFFRFTYVADHFQYLASIGMIALAASGATLALTRLSPAARTCGIAVCFLLIGALSVLTWRQSRLYGDVIRLYETTIEHNPACWMAHDNLGLDLMKRGDRKAAIAHFEDAIRIKHDYFDAHVNLGVALVGTGQVEKGIDHYREAIRLAPKKYETHIDLASALLQIAKLPEAEQEYHAALALHPDDPTILNGLAAVLMEMGRYPEAEEFIQCALRIKGDDAASHNSLGLVFVHSGQPQRAVEQFQETLKTAPNDVTAHNNLGILYAGAGDAASAVVHFQEAVHQSPDTPHFRTNLGECLLHAGRPAESLEQFQAALRLQPGVAPTYGKLARALALLNRSDEAVAAVEKGISVARSAGQETAAGELEQWLQRYQIELRRNGNAGTNSEQKSRSKQQAR